MKVKILSPFFIFTSLFAFAQNNATTVKEYKKVFSTYYAKKIVE
jgi:hypothetical protein